MALTTTNNSLEVKDNNTFALTAPKSINAYVLTSNTAYDVTVSALTDAGGKEAMIVDFSANQDFYVLWGSTGAAVPAANILDGTSPELNPSTRAIRGVTTFSIVSPVGCIVTMKIYPFQ